MDDDIYRDVLERVAGVRSASGLTVRQKEAVVSEFKRMGWKGQKREISKKGYVRKIFAIWGQLKRDGVWSNPDPASLRAFVKKMTGCDDPEWLSFSEASDVIEALKKMGQR
ncbi:MAG: regulatory protein GemA [Marinibacterium sp.]|nr:regulatory protein GemA [Marinibacterium sp.]